MVYILLRVLLQTLFTQSIRFGQARGVPVVGLALINYGFAALACLALAAVTGSLGFSRPTLIYGGLAGVAYLVSLLMIPPSMRESGVAISVAVLQLAVLLPVAHAMAFFGERPSAAQAVGLLLAIAALIVLSTTTSAPTTATNPDRGPTVVVAAPARARFSPILIPLFVIAGFSGVAMKSFQVYGPPREQMSFNAVLFFFATLSSIVAFARRGRPAMGEILRRDTLGVGLVMGAANTGQLITLMLALASLPALLVFPVTSALSLVANALVSVRIWGEWIRPAGWIGLGLALAASVLLNIGD
jgi:multidrug transporter EmrE-like cation transporter